VTRTEKSPTNSRKRGRPRTLDGGRRVAVYLDGPSIAEAQRQGGGEISAGIRHALLLTKTIQTP